MTTAKLLDKILEKARKLKEGCTCDRDRRYHCANCEKLIELLLGAREIESQYRDIMKAYTND